MSLKQIAQLTGTSISTVSRVLNDPNHHTVNKELRDKIWNAVKDTSYVPNASARALKKGNFIQPTYSVDILLTRFSSLETDIFFKELFMHIQEQLLENHCILGDILYIPDLLAPKKTSPKAVQKQNRALIILGKCTDELVSKLYKKYANFIGINRNPTNFVYDEIICSGLDAATKAMEYLISLGHKKIAYIGDCTYESRYIGYYESLISNKIPLNYAYIYPSKQTVKEGKEIFQKILQTQDRPSAILCANDCTALGVLDAMKRLRRKGYKPSVISIDNIEEASHTIPMLTTIDIPKREMAHLAVIMLLDKMKGYHQANIHVELPCTLRIRESCNYNYQN